MTLVPAKRAQADMPIKPVNREDFAKQWRSWWYWGLAIFQLRDFAQPTWL